MHVYRYMYFILVCICVVQSLYGVQYVHLARTAYVAYVLLRARTA